MRNEIHAGARQYAARVDSQSCWVAEAAQHEALELLGYGILDRSFFHQNFVSLLMVKETARGQRIATALMIALEAQCAGAKLFTSTNASNLPMRQLLRKLEFIERGHIENLDVGDPEIVFVKLAPRGYPPAGNCQDKSDS